VGERVWTGKVVGSAFMAVAGERRSRC
jgi:hypothetical protein